MEQALNQEALVALAQRFAEALTNIAKSVDKSEQAEKKATSIWSRITDNVSKAWERASTNISSVSNAITSATSNLSAAVFSNVSRFVEAFDPSSVNQFNMALRDLMAVLGAALLPVLEQITTIVREFSNSLLGNMESMKPLIQAIVTTTLVLGTLTVALAGVQAVLSVLGGPLSLLILIGGAIVQMTGGLDNLYQAIKPVIDIMFTVARVIQDSLVMVAESLINIITPAQGLFSRLIDFIRSFVDAVVDLYNSVFGRSVQKTNEVKPESAAGLASQQARSTTAEAIGANARLAAFGVRSPIEREGEKTRAVLQANKAVLDEIRSEIRSARTEQQRSNKRN